jgi:hypothetical protein
LMPPKAAAPVSPGFCAVILISLAVCRLSPRPAA